MIGSDGYIGRIIPVGPAVWTRPADWLALPAIGAQEFIGLVAVQDDEVGYLALSATTSAGTYHVDWGDGTTSDVASTVAAEHLYAYADLAGTDSDRKSTRLNSSHIQKSRMPSSA